MSSTDADNYTAEARFTVAANETPTTSISETAGPACGEDIGRIEVSTSGMTAPLTYAWSHDELW